MKKLLFIFFIIPVISYAEEDVNKKLTQACERHSASLITRIKSDVITDVSQEEAQKMIALSMETCTAYFRRVFNQQNIAQADNEAKKDNDDSDWFTDKFLTGDDEKSDGDKRLKRRY